MSDAAKPSTNGHGPADVPPKAEGTSGPAADGIEFEALGTPAGGTTSPKMLVPLFVVPLLIVAVIVGIFYVVGSLVSHEKTLANLIQELQSGGVNERWQAAANLSQIALKDPAALADPATRRRLRDVFQVAGPDDTRLRRYLAELWGEIGDVEAIPIMMDAVGKMKESMAALKEPDPKLEERISGELIYYLFSLGRLGNVDAEPTILGCSADADAGVRKAVAVSLGDLARKGIAAHRPPSAALVAGLVKLHDDADAWVRMNAAIALAKADRTEGVATLEAMLDRAWLKGQKLQFPDDGHYTVTDHDPAAIVMTSAMLAIDHLVDVAQSPSAQGGDGPERPKVDVAALRRAVTALASDPNPKVQEHAKAILGKLGT